MSAEGPRRSEREPELPEPYESLIRWQAGSVGSAPVEQARARLFALLARDLVQSIGNFNATTTRLNRVLIGLTFVLVMFGALQVWLIWRGF